MQFALAEFSHIVGTDEDKGDKDHNEKAKKENRKGFIYSFAD